MCSGRPGPEAERLRGFSPYVSVGRVHIQRQDITGTLASEKCDALAFNQWRARTPSARRNHGRTAHLQARVWRELNHEPQGGEPASADDVLPLSSIAMWPARPTDDHPRHSE
jgi:hypothetical protein